MTPGDPGFSDVPGVFKRLFHTEKSILSGGSAESSGYFMLYQESQHFFPFTCATSYETSHVTHVRMMQIIKNISDRPSRHGLSSFGVGGGE